MEKQVGRMKKWKNCSVIEKVSEMNNRIVARRYQSQQLEMFEAIQKEEIFNLVYRFLVKAVDLPEFLQQLQDELQFQQISKKPFGIDPIPTQKIQANSETSNPSFPTNESLDDTNNLGPRKNQKIKCKISILALDSLEDTLSCSSSFSTDSLPSLSTINPPLLPLTLQIVQDIFQQPEPFLINLTLCLLLKFLRFSHHPLTNTNAVWILAVATILAYKFYFDSPVEGLMGSFQNILNITKNTLTNLEAYFLNQIQHRVIIENQQYAIVLAHIIAINSI